eukprot:gene8160-793_t
MGLCVYICEIETSVWGWGWVFLLGGWLNNGCIQMNTTNYNLLLTRQSNIRRQIISPSINNSRQCSCNILHTSNTALLVCGEVCGVGDIEDTCAVVILHLLVTTTTPPYPYPLPLTPYPGPGPTPGPTPGPAPCPLPIFTHYPLPITLDPLPLPPTPYPLPLTPYPLPLTPYPLPLTLDPLPFTLPLALLWLSSLSTLTKTAAMFIRLQNLPAFVLAVLYS